MLKLKIVSPEKIEFDGEVVSVLVPGTAEGKKSLEIIGGFVSVNQNQVNLCVEL